MSDVNVMHSPLSLSLSLSLSVSLSQWRLSLPIAANDTPISGSLTDSLPKAMKMVLVLQLGTQLRGMAEEEEEGEMLHVVF